MNNTGTVEESGTTSDQCCRRVADQGLTVYRFCFCRALVRTHVESDSHDSHSDSHTIAM